MIILYNMMDIRTGQVYSQVVVSARNRKYFVPITESGQLEEGENE